jgi:hypothetical protein
MIFRKLHTFLRARRIHHIRLHRLITEYYTLLCNVAPPMHEEDKAQVAYLYAVREINNRQERALRRQVLMQAKRLGIDIPKR